MRANTRGLVTRFSNIIVWSSRRSRWFVSIAALSLAIGGASRLGARTATQVVFAPTPPSTMSTSAGFAHLQAAIEDANGNVDTSAQTQLTLQIFGQAPSNFQQITEKETAVNGIATFNPQIAMPGTYTVTVAADGLTVATTTVTVTNDGGTLGTANVGQSLPSTPVQIDFSAPTTIASIQVTTQGVPNLDFVESTNGPGSCDFTGHIYQPGDNCVVNVVFTPTAAGFRTGAVVLTDTNANVTNILISGTGVGSMATFGSGTVTNLFPGGVNWTQTTATDAAGNVYVPQNLSLLKFPAGGGAPVVVAFSHSVGCNLVAVDGAGRVYAAFGGPIVVLPAGATNVAIDSPSTVFYGDPNAFAHPTAMALDANGDIFLANHFAGNVLEIPSVNGVPQTSQQRSFNGVASDGLAFDAAGNLYTTSIGDGTLNETPLENGALNFAHIHQVLSGLTFPEGIAFDASGSLYLGEDGLGVRQIPLQNGSFNASASTQLLTTVQTPSGIALDSLGNVYVADGAPNHWQVLAVNLQTPPTLQFTASVGQVSASQSLAVFNAGNAPLNFQGASATAPFSLPGNGCSQGPQTPASSCSLVAIFQPSTFGQSTGSISLSDDAVNQSSATQTIPLVGNATKEVPSVTVELNSPAPPDPVYGQLAPMSIDVISQTGGQHPGGTFSVTVDGGAPQTVPVNVTGLTPFGPGSLPTGGHSVDVTYNPDANSSYATATGQLTFGVDRAPALFQVNVPAPYAYGQQPSIIVTFQTTGNQVPPTGTITYQIDTQTAQTVAIGTNPAAVSLPLGLLPVVNNGSGSHSVTITYNGDGNFTPQLLTTAHVTVTPASSSVQINTSGANVVFGNDSQVVVTVSGANGGAIPSGGITYQLDANAQQFVALTNGSATIDLGSQLGAATHSLNVTYPGDQNYSLSSAGASVFVTKANQSIAFTNLPTSLPNNTPPITLTATGGGSGNPVTFTASGASTSGTNGSTLTLTASTGSSITVSANQTGNGNYNAAPQRQATIAVTQVATHLSLTGVPPFRYVGGQLNPVTVTVLDTFNRNVTTVSSPVQVAVTGPNNFSQTLAGSTMNGSVNIDLTTIAPAVTSPGTYTVTATNGALPAVSAQVQVIPLSVTLPSELVGTPAPAQLVTFFFTAQTTVTNGLVVTNGVSQSLDFAKASSGSNCVGSHNANTSCVVNVVFTPKAAGLRTGAVVLYGSNNKPIQTVYLNGIGTGAAVAYSGVTPSAVVTATNPIGIAVDPNGNRYVASGSSVLKIAPNGTQTTVATGFSMASGVVIDGAGNLATTDAGAGSITQIPNENGVLILADAQALNGLGSPSAIATDGAGNIAIANLANGTVIESSPTSSGALTLATGLVSPTGVAFDPAGNLYVVDSGANAVYQVPFQNGALNSAAKATVWSCNGCTPLSVATDAAGDVYIGTGSALVEVPNENGVLNANDLITLDQAAGATNAYQGLAMDGAGNLHVSRGDLNAIGEYVRGSGTAIPNFGSVTIGQTSTPASETVQNIGNQPLAFSAINFNASFPNQQSTCTTTTSLNAGFTCVLTTTFAPTAAGPVNGTISVSDNASNATSPQTINESGTGLNAQTITFTLASPVSYAAQSIALSATGGGSGNPVTFSIVSGAQFATLSGSTLTLTGAGAITIQADQAASATYAAAAPVQQTLVVNVAMVTATVTAASKPYDGTTSVTIANCTLSVIDPNLTCVTRGAAFSDPSVGTNKNVTGIALGGSAAGFYRLTGPFVQTNASITAIPATVTAASGSKPFGSLDPTLTTTETGFLQADVNQIRLSTTRAAGEAPGLYVTTPTAMGEPLTNYNVTYVTGTFVILQTAYAVRITSVPPVVYQNQRLGTITVSVLDQSGTLVTSFSGSVTLAISGPGPVPAPPPLTANAVNGVATFDASGISFASAGPATLAASSAGLRTDQQSFTVFPVLDNFAPTPVLPGFPPVQPITLGFAADTTIGSAAVLTQGVPGLDFQLPTGPIGVNCVGLAPRTFHAGETCQIAVAFAPTTAGVRLGGLELYDANGAIVRTVYLSGIGTGAVAATFGTTSAIPNGADSGPFTVAVDGAANLYIAGAQYIRFVPFQNGALNLSANAQVTLALPDPALTAAPAAPFAGLAIDGSGTLFISASNGLWAIHCLANGTLDVNNPVLVLQGATGVLAVDPSNNLFAEDNGQLVEVLAGSSFPATPTTIPLNGLQKPLSLAFDSRGDLTVADGIGTTNLPAGFFANPGLHSDQPGEFGPVLGVAIDGADADLFALNQIPPTRL